jgi:hypothetical protein
MAQVFIERLEDWLGQDVFDPEGERIGKLEEVYLAGEEVVLAEVRTGGLRKRSHLVPVRGMTVGREYVRADHSVRKVTEAPGPAKDAEPDDATLRAVADHYGLAPGEGAVEGSKARAARLAAAAAAEARARELEQEAMRQEQASAAAADAKARAAQEAEAARLEAERKRTSG